MTEIIASLIGIDYQAIFDASPDATFILNALGRILYANRTAVSRYGYNLEEFQLMNIADLAAAGMADAAPVKLDLPLKSGAMYEFRHRFKDGNELPVEIFLETIILHGEQVYLSRIRDITRRKALESELHHKKYLLNRILDTEPGTVCIYNLLEPQYVYVNRNLLSAFGYPVEDKQSVGPDLTEIFHPDDLPDIVARRTAWRDAADGDIRAIEFRIRTIRGDWNWLASHETPFSRDAGGQVSQILGIAYDITERKRAEILLNGQNRLLDMIASGAALPETLTALVRLIEEQSSGMLGSILLLDEDGMHVRHGAAPSLPEEFVAAVDGQPIGPVAGSCGTAAWRREAVFVEDIETDPLWVTYKAAALPHGLRACWSTPIFDVQHQVLGTFAMYYRQAGLPEAEHLRLIDAATHIAGIAISRHLTEKSLLYSRSRLLKAQHVAHMGFLEWNLKTNEIVCSDVVYDMYGVKRSEVPTTPDFIGKLVHPDDVESVQRNLDLAIKRIKPYHIDHRILRPDGDIVWVHAQAEITNDPDTSSEILLGTVVDITARKLAEANIQRLSQLYAALSQCNQAIVRCTSEEELFPHICRDAVNFGGMKMAWIGMMDAATRLIKPVASYGAGIAYLDGIEISTNASSPYGRGPTGTAVRENKPVWVQDFLHDPGTAAWHERAATFGWGGSASLPLLCRGVVVGSFTLLTGDTHAFDEPAQNLLIEMAMDISFALDRFAGEAERKQAEEALRASEQHLRAIVETEPECVKVLGRDGRLLEMNTAGLAMLEVDTLDIARQHNLLDFIVPEYRNAFKALHQRVMGGENDTLEFEIVGFKGTKRWLETHAAPMRDADGKVSTLLGITRDITERKFNEARIKYLANFDVLTGLPNRAQLDDHLNYALSLAKRSNGLLAVMFIDIDRFKDINDTLGHSIGDAILIEVARRLKLALREEDTASRLGGDEFILMLPGNDAQGAAQVAQKLLQAISEPYLHEQHDLSVTASIGIALFPEDGEDMETLSRRADTAMYRAKQEGRDGYRFYTSEMQARATRNMQLVNALRHALDRDQFRVHYQPQISIEDGRIVGVEALLRWQHPDLGNVSPAEFIPVAEDSGLILPIGEWVLRTAVQQLKRWLDSGRPPMVMAVNLSAVQFRHPSLPDMVTQILDAAHLPPACLELELTESVAMHDPLGAIAVMNDLHRRGVRMSIDDFGTGYSSLNYLKKFKVYKLKIDQSFVRDIGTDSEDRAIVAAIISMAGNLGMQTIAEGVETTEQLAFLRYQGCDEAQGYYFSKPLPADQLERFFAGDNA